MTLIGHFLTLTVPSAGHGDTDGCYVTPFFAAFKIWKRSLFELSVEIKSKECHVPVQKSRPGDLLLQRSLFTACPSAGPTLEGSIGNVGLLVQEKLLHSDYHVPVAL